MEDADKCTVPLPSGDETAQDIHNRVITIREFAQRNSSRCFGDTFLRQRRFCDKQLSASEKGDYSTWQQLRTKKLRGKVRCRARTNSFDVDALYYYSVEILLLNTLLASRGEF